MEIPGIGIHGILPTIRGVGTHGAGILIGLCRGALHGVRAGVMVGDRHTDRHGVPVGVRHGAGVRLKHGDRLLLPAHHARITT